MFLDKADITTAAKHLTRALQEAQHQLPKFQDAPINDILTEWFLTREEYEALDEVRKEIGKLLESVSRETIPVAMKAKDTKTITIDSLQRRFTVSTRASCSIQENKKDEAFEYLRSNGQGGIIQETINSSTLARWAREWAEAGNDIPDALFRVSVMNTTSATKI